MTSTAATKTTFIATAPNGTQIKRKTNRSYSHAVLVFGQTRYEKENNLPASWGAVSFNGREDLAVKEAAKWIKAGLFEHVLVVEVVPA